MRKPRNSTPLALSDLKYDPSTNLYYRLQDGITYAMPLELTRHLKEYYRHYYSGTTGKIDCPSMDTWYRALKKDEKKLVIRQGNMPKERADFYPDVTYD